MNKALTTIAPAMSLTEETTDRIRDAILSGELPLGSKLSEQRLADMLGISRSPVRDAFAALQSEGLVNVFAKRGSFVFTPDLKDVNDLCEHRAILEGASLSKAIKSNRALLLSGLKDAVEIMQNAMTQNDPNAFTKGDIEFHNTIISSGGNRSVGLSYRRTTGPLIALRTHLFISMNEKLDRSMGEHLALIKAVEQGQIETAVKLIEEHIFHLSEAYQSALNSVD